MDYKLGWNYLVSEYKKNFDAQEDKIQTLWESYFAMPFIFNYSDSDDIDSKRSLHIGSKDREIPDIILRSNHKDICTIELKRYTLPKTSDFEKQLLNYMSHTDMRLSIGVLICKTINIYYYNYATNEKKCFEFTFEENSSFGEKFVELFSKDNISEEKIKLFIEEQNKLKSTADKIKEELSIDLIKQLLHQHFIEKYPEQDVSRILSETNISINETRNIEIMNTFVKTNNSNYKIPPKISTDKRTVVLNGVELPIYRSGYQSVQDFVKQTLQTLFGNKILTNNEIMLLQDKQYSQKVFDIQFPLLEKNHANTIDNTGHSRYWSNFRVDGFYVCSQWWKQKFDIYDRMIASWLVSLENNRK